MVMSYVNLKVLLRSKGFSMNNDNIQKVEIVDIRMSFLSMVIFMVKAVIASIPAMIILMIIGTLTFGVLGGLMSGISSF